MTSNNTIFVKDFTTKPGSALAKDGLYSGEEFRESFVRPAFNTLFELVKDDEESKERLTIDMDGAYGYSHQWLDELYGGMICYSTPAEASVFGRFVVVKCDTEPYLLETIQKITGESLDYMDNLEKKNSNPNDSQKVNGEISGNNGEIGPNQHILVAGGKDTRKITACRNNFTYPCWCCEFSPDFKGTVRHYSTKCIHGFDNGAGCGVCDPECKTQEYADICEHGWAHKGRFCRRCNPIIQKQESVKCSHGFKKEDCSECATVCTHGYLKQECGVCAECPHGVNQSGLGCDKCDYEDISFDPEDGVWKVKSFKQAAEALRNYQDEEPTQEDELLTYMQGLLC
jgi:hypothetical protein